MMPLMCYARIAFLLVGIIVIVPVARGISYPLPVASRGVNASSTLYPVDLRNFTIDEQIALSSLQGSTSQYAPLFYLLPSGMGKQRHKKQTTVWLSKYAVPVETIVNSYATWLDELRIYWGVSVESLDAVHSVPAAIEIAVNHFVRARLGYVRTGPTDTESVAIGLMACSVAQAKGTVDLCLVVRRVGSKRPHLCGVGEILDDLSFKGV